MTRPQSARILDWLATGRSLTPLQALHKFGCLRLGARVYDLRQSGHRIRATLVEVGCNKRVARYTLSKGPG